MRASNAEKNYYAILGAPEDVFQDELFPSPRRGEMFIARTGRKRRTPLGVRCLWIGSWSGAGCEHRDVERIGGAINMALLKECVILVVVRAINIALLRSERWVSGWTFSEAVEKAVRAAEVTHVFVDHG